MTRPTKITNDIGSIPDVQKSTERFFTETRYIRLRTHRANINIWLAIAW